jgi:hypothetical protein
MTDKRAPTFIRVVLGIAVIAAICFVGYEMIGWRDAQVRRRVQMKLAGVKHDIDARFPTGAPKSDVLAFLRSRFVEAGCGGTDQNCDLFYVDQEPSGVWYCGPIDVGILVAFRDDRLVETRVSGRANNCL